MGTEDRFKKQQALNRERTEGSRIPRPGSLLIVTEGEKTEPLYLGGMRDYIKASYPKARLDICVQGVGMGTVALVNKAIEIANRAPAPYENKWVCFDKDDFKDFDEAIALAGTFGFKVAWSNQAFEYWLYLHFYYAKSALHRDIWFEKVDETLQAWGLGRYAKNMENMFSVFAADGRLKAAIRNAAQIRKEYQRKDIPPSQRDPCTTVDELVHSLEEYLDEFLK